MAIINLNFLRNVSLFLMFFATGFGVAETLYFGSNFYPLTHSEMTCDMVASMIAGAGSGLYITYVVLYTKTFIRNKSKREYREGVDLDRQWNDILNDLK